MLKIEKKFLEIVTIYSDSNQEMKNSMIDKEHSFEEFLKYNERLSLKNIFKNQTVLS